MSRVVEILKEGRRLRGWSQEELAHRALMHVSTVSRVEQKRGMLNVNSLRRLAVAIEYDPDLLVSMAKNPGAAPPAGKLPAMPGITTGDRLALGAKAAGDSSLPPPRTTRVPFFGGVSAVRLDERVETGGAYVEVPDLDMDFVIQVDGQCMEPRFEDGERVGCSVRRWQREGFVWGKDYWIRFKNGEMTLKRVRPDPRHDDRFRCVPLNLKAEPFARLISDVESAARVVAVMPA
jgi:transcriptional regulator with XRE-family HTH domain